MADKKQQAQAKPGVKFQDQPASVQQVENKPQVIYKNATEQKDQALKQFNKVQTLFKTYTASDPQCIRKDTAQSLKSLLASLRDCMQVLNIGTFEDKNSNYYLIYNGTVYIFDICRVLRKSIYQYIAIEFLAFCITSMEGCIVLTSIKYLDWRIKLYVELAHIYHSLQSKACAYRTIDLGLQKVQELRELEEMDPPLMDYMDKILKQNTRLLKILELKFKVQAGVFTVDQWKKKIEEFGQDKEARCLAIIESLRFSPPNLSNTVKQTHVGNQLKEQLVQVSFDLLKNDMERIAIALEQQMDKITKTVEFKSKNILDELERNDMTKKRREFEASLIKEKEWRALADGLPLEYQIEFAHHAYDVGNIKVFEDISNSAYVRCKYRRIEVPYIQDVNILISTNPYPNIPNGYDKIQIDINEANLRTELKRLRNKNKGDQQQQQQQTQKKDDKKDNKKQPQQQEQEKQQTDQVGLGVQATDSELAQINHNYIYLVYKKSMTPDNAIYEIDVVMADEEQGPVEKMNQGYRAIAIPIKQYTGVREKYKTVPYLLLKHTMNELSDENEKMTLLVGIKPLFGKNPLIRPDFGYQKINLDLRQTPKEFIRSPGMDYIYITQKTDKYYFVKERELQILIHFIKLEKSYQKEISQSIEDDSRLELEICYDLQSLKELMDMISSCLVGPLGIHFLKEKRDFLSQLVFLLWRKYFLPPLYQMQFIQELLITQEMSRQDYSRYDKLIQTAREIFKNGLLVLNEILFKIPYVDIILLCKVNLSLAKFLEEEKEAQVAEENLKICIDRIIQHRNSLTVRGVDSQKDLFLPFAVTCSNFKIDEMMNRMREAWINQKNQINREIRIKNRSNNKKQQLEDDELNEEEYELLEAYQSLLGDDNKDTSTLSIQQKINETDLIINALHADLTVALYRCQLKAGLDIQKNSIKKTSLEEEVEGVSQAIQKKMSIMQGETAQTIKKNVNQLQSTLQKEGKLKPPKPVIHQFETEIMNQVNKNPYANCLLYMLLASIKQKQTEQRSFLVDSLKFLQQAEKEEQLHIENGINDAIFVMSTLCDNIDTQSTSNNVFPYNMLYNPQYIKSTQVPRKPILISRNSESVTFKLPPFKPKLLDMIAIDQAKKTITSMAIFGKISANGVNVSLTCNDLNNTGIRQKIGAIVTMNGLQRNEKYCFAVAAYDGTEGVSNGIGETGDDITTLHPLPLPLLASYLCKVAYQLSNFDICEEAADFCIMQFTEDSEFIDRQLHNELNPIHIKRLLQQRIKSVSLMEIQNLTETLLIKAKCLQKKITNTGTQAQKHIVLLKICNYLLLSLETSLCCRHFTIAKRIVAELYNMLESFQQEKPLQVFHLLLKAQIIIVEIPKQYWDANLRILSAKFTYEILKVCMKLNEITLGRRVITAELQSFNRKWYQVPKIIMIEQVEDTKKDTKKDVKKGGKPQQIDEPAQPPKQVPKLIRELYEVNSTVQDYLEETLLAMNDEFGDYVPSFVEKWKEQIDQLIPYMENPSDQIDKIFSELSIRLEYWECIKDLSTATQKLPKQHPIYIEMLCKLIRRMIQSNIDYKIIQPLAVFNEQFQPSVALANDITQIQQKCIQLDIEFYPALLPELIIDKNTNKVGNDDAIQLFEEFNTKKTQLLEQLKIEGQTINRFGIMSKAKRFEYVQLWRSELSYLKAILSYKSNRIRLVDVDCFVSVFNLDIEHLKELINENESQKQIKQQQQALQQQKEQQLQQLQQQSQQKQPPAKQPPGKQQVQQPIVELSEEEELIQLSTQIIKNVADACGFAVWSKQYIVMLNHVKFLYNFLLKEQITPFIHLGQCWQDLCFIGNCINMLIREVKDHGWFQVKEQAENELALQPHMPQQDFVFEPPLPNTEPIRPSLLTQLSKDCWFSKYKDMDLLANIMAYIVQSLMVEQKWNSLIGISRQFCNLTTHYYSQYILPFTIHAQTILFKEAQNKTQLKQEELNARTQAFQVWEQTKKKKTRSSLLTQEIPQEEQDYRADREMLIQQIHLLQQKQDFIENQLKVSEKLIQEINRDANQALENLKQARKLYEKFAIDDELLSKESIQLEFNSEQFLLKQTTIDKKQLQLMDQTLKQKKKNHKQFGMQVISKYKLTCELLHKRQEKFAQALALKELGSLNFAMQNYAQAEESWSESLDTIFQRIFVLKSSAFRQIIQECNKNNQLLAQTYGIQQCLIGVTLCSILAYNCYYSNCHQQRESAILASELVSSVLKLQMINGLDWQAFIHSKEVAIGNIFNDRYVLDPAELALSCERCAWLLLDRDEALRAVPLINLLGELSNRLQSNFYSVRAKLLRSIALSSIGYINQAYQALLQIANEKDLPDQSSSLWQSRVSGKWWYSNLEWNNSIPPYDEKHTQLTEKILKELELTREFGLKYGLQNENIFNYAVALLVYNIHSGDIIEKWEINDLRCKFLIKVESILRNTLNKLNQEEQIEQKILTKPKEEILADPKMEDYYHLQGTTKQIGVTNNQEALTYLQKREERMYMMARSRNLMAKVNVSMGQITRALYIFKYAIENLQSYTLELSTNENGEELENLPWDQLKPQGVVEDKKGAKKAPEKKGKEGKESKDKPIADEAPAVKTDAQIKLEETILQIVEARKTRHSINIYYWIKLRTELTLLLYRHNRHDEALEYMEILMNDCKQFNDNFHQRLIIEYQARIQFKKGKSVESIKKFKEAIEIGQKNFHQDPQMIVLYGDLGEIYYEKNELQEAKQQFYDAYQMAEQLMQMINYGYGVVPNWNQKCGQEKIQICQDLCVPLEIEQEILKKTDKQIKTTKKDEKKKDDGKVVRKGADKQTKKDNIDKPQMPIKGLNQLPNFNFIQPTKLTYTTVDIDTINNTQYQYNCYLKNIELWQRASLRYVDIMITLNQANENSTISIDSQESSVASDSESDKSSVKDIFDINVISEIVNKIDTSISKSINVPISFRLELYYLQSKIFKMRFVQLLLNLQQKYFMKYLSGKNKKYADFYEKRPHRDLVRNKYFLLIPPFCQLLKEQGLQYLMQAKESLSKAISVIRGEAVLFEYNRKPEDILVAMAEICLFIREYRVRQGYRYVKVDYLQSLINSKNTEQNKIDLEQQLISMERSDRLEQLNLELEAQSYLKYAIELVKARQELLENFAAVALTPLPDVNKLALEIYTEIIEQDYQYKKKYNPMLFDESKKKVGVSSMDVLQFIQKVWREAKVMTFSGAYLQRMISKTHRFLKLHMQSYQKCLITSLEVAPKNDVNAVFIDEGIIVTKLLYNPVAHEFKVLYVLGGLNKDKIITSLSKEEKDKLIISDEKNVLYGNIYITDANISMLLQDALNLQSKMKESDQQSQKMKERDYKHHKKAFYKLIEQLGFYFFQKPSTIQMQNGQTHETVKKNVAFKKSESFMQEQNEPDILAKYEAIVPELTHDNITILINLFNDQGVLSINHNYLAILRYFHHQKYK
ncbi:unnamed protein product [Paramecium pentaurelia]|uniref:Uncharacterized protein n=1 Tax=Paramecium pentaurelia TaxID=43138 RepID=A0A8S1XIF7_9CILI|nr:unnamed protein product [Paramecium pentaurelia]